MILCRGETVQDHAGLLLLLLVTNKNNSLYISAPPACQACAGSVMYIISFSSQWDPERWWLLQSLYRWGKLRLRETWLLCLHRWWVLRLAFCLTLKPKFFPGISQPFCLCQLGLFCTTFQNWSISRNAERLKISNSLVFDLPGDCLQESQLAMCARKYH